MNVLRASIGVGIGSTIFYKLYQDSVNKQAELIAEYRKDPTVYGWSKQASILFTKPKEIEPIMPNQILRSLEMHQERAVAIDFDGNLIEWNMKEGSRPLNNKNLIDAKLSKECTVALSKNGELYKLDDHEITRIKQPSLEWFEKIVEIETGLHHLIALSNKGNVFTLPLSKKACSNGQLGHLESNEDTLQKLNGIKAVQVAAGDEHSLIRTKNGTVLSFGSNSLGQLGLSSNTVGVSFHYPAIVKFEGLKCTNISAGGNNSMFVVENDSECEVYSCGDGRFGQLGIGVVQHLQPTPIKIKSLSNLKEYGIDGDLRPIRVSSIKTGPFHSCCVLDNEIGTGFGKDVLFWGHSGGIMNLDGSNSNCLEPVPGKSLIKLPGSSGEEKLQIAPKGEVLANGKKVQAEQALSLGHKCTVVYFKLTPSNHSPVSLSL